jgi:hypothetical protein
MVLRTNGNYMYHLLYRSLILHCTVFILQCIYGFRMILRINNDYFLKER